MLLFNTLLFKPCKKGLFCYSRLHTSFISLIPRHLSTLFHFHFPPKLVRPGYCCTFFSTSGTITIERNRALAYILPLKCAVSPFWRRTFFDVVDVVVFYDRWGPASTPQPRFHLSSPTRRVQASLSETLGPAYGVHAIRAHVPRIHSPN